MQWEHPILKLQSYTRPISTVGIVAQSPSSCSEAHSRAFPLNQLSHRTNKGSANMIIAKQQTPTPNRIRDDL